MSLLLFGDESVTLDLPTTHLQQFPLQLQEVPLSKYILSSSPLPP